VNQPAGRLWTGNDRLLLAATTLLGFGLVAAGWFGTSGEVEVRREVPWLNLGVTGVLLLSAGQTQWILAARKRVGERRVRLLPDGRPATVAVPAPARLSAVPALATVVATEAMTRYHRPDCQLVAGKPATSDRRETHEADGRTACTICQP
jgi:hypothetical protein